MGAKTASWSDVRAKAQAIRAAGGVRIIDVSGMQITAEVKSTTGNVYQPSLLLGPNKKVDYWLCTCAWQAYAWERTGKWRKYEGRQCAHALALLYEVQSQGMFGREIGTESGHDEPITFYEPPSRVAVLSSSLWWRIHDPKRPFTIDDATSTTFNSGITSIGYSAFKNPWHLFLYLNANRMYQDGRTIIGFSGKRIGTGADGEDLIMPDMVTVQRFDIPGFERELATTPLPDSPKFADGWWGYSSWAEERRNFSDFELGEDPVIDRIILKAAGLVQPGVSVADAYELSMGKPMKVAASGPERIYRGVLVDNFTGDAQRAMRFVDGLATVEDVLAQTGHSGVGIWWLRERDGGQAEAREYAQGGAGSEELLAAQVGDGDDWWNYGQLEVVLVGLAPEGWDPEDDGHVRQVMPGMGSSFIDQSRSIQLVEVQYNAGRGWQIIPTSRTVTAGFRSTAYQGVCIPIEDLATAKRYMEACAAGDQRAAIDIVVHLISAGSRTQWWNAGAADANRGSGGWWSSNSSVAYLYSDSVSFDLPGIPLVLTAQDDPSWERYHEEDAGGTWWWHLPPGTPVNLIDAVAEIHSPAQARANLESFAGQGQYATISEFGGTPNNGVEVHLPLGSLPRTANHPREPAVSWQDKVSALPNTSAWDMIIEDAQVDVEERGISEQADPETFWREVYQQAVTEGSAKGLSTTEVRA